MSPKVPCPGLHWAPVSDPTAHGGGGVSSQAPSPLVICTAWPTRVAVPPALSLSRAALLRPAPFSRDAGSSRLPLTSVSVSAGGSGVYEGSQGQGGEVSVGEQGLGGGEAQWPALSRFPRLLGNESRALFPDRTPPSTPRLVLRDPDAVTSHAQAQERGLPGKGKGQRTTSPTWVTPLGDFLMDPPRILLHVVVSSGDEETLMCPLRDQVSLYGS